MSLIMDGLESSDYDRTYSDWALLRRIIRYFKPYRLHMLLVVLAVTVSGLAGAFIPLFISQILDSLNQGVDFSAITLLVLIVIFASVVNFFTNAVSQEVTARAVQGTIMDLRKDASNASFRRSIIVPSKRCI